VDLDLLVRHDLLTFLKCDSEKRGATILCMYVSPFNHHAAMTLCADATHIFEGLDNFATHVAHMRFGSFATPSIPWPPSPATDQVLSNVALQWLKEDREIRRQLEQQGLKTRGARRDEVWIPTLVIHSRRTSPLTYHSPDRPIRFRNILQEVFRTPESFLVLH
jgi:CCR4-NOT complex subunit CAF16